MSACRQYWDGKKRTITKNLTNDTDQRECSCKSEAHANRIKCRGKYSLFLGKSFCTTKNKTVYNDQRDKDSQCLIQFRGIGLHQQLNNSYVGCNDGNKD